MKTPATFSLFAALIFLACGSPPTPAEVDEAARTARTALAAAERGRVALDLLGLLPNYTCGQPRRVVALSTGAVLLTSLPCATISTRQADTFDEVQLQWRANCPVGGRTLGGVTVFRYSGGDERFDVTADLTRTTLDGTALDATASYGQCGDEKRLGATAKGTLANGTAFDTALTVGKRDGLPLIGSTTLLINGAVTVQAPTGIDQLNLKDVLYDVGNYVPHGGSLHARNSKGQTVEVRFAHTLWKLGKAEVFLDGAGPYTVPVVQ